MYCLKPSRCRRRVEIELMKSGEGDPSASEEIVSKIKTSTFNGSQYEIRSSHSIEMAHSKCDSNLFASI